MANWQVATDMAQKIWKKRTIKMYKDKEYFRRHGLIKAGETAIIGEESDLTRGPGDRIIFDYLIALSGAGLTGSVDAWTSGLSGVYGSDGLSDTSSYGSDHIGNITAGPNGSGSQTWGSDSAWATDDGYGKLINREEPMLFRKDEVQIGRKRNGIRKEGRWLDQLIRDRFRTEAHTLLSDWLANITTAMIMMHVTGNTNWKFPVSALAPTTNARYELNRSLFGGTATSVGTIVEGETFTLYELDRMRELAEMSVPKLQPYKTRDGEDIFFVAIHPFQASALRQDGDWKDSCYHARAEGDKNPLFCGSLGEWNGLTVHEHRYVPQYTDGGASGNLPYCRAVLLGQNAACYATGHSSEWIEDGGSAFADYGNRPGLGIDIAHGIKKKQFSLVSTTDTAGLIDIGVISMATYATNLSGASVI